MPDSAQKTADPFLNEGFAFTGTRQNRWSGSDVAPRASMQALFKRGGFPECAEQASALPGRPFSSRFVQPVRTFNGEFRVTPLDASQEQSI
ncbi:MAG: hypothetical protein O9274_09420 [Limnobacter sp.]|uniref:hypothetical protein n=1 Tax=Limnobacter sp. TaxID=2003368 RepID=UPI0022BB1A06|nr:hypothetical protein [Limnobacter sp.]MCZ8015904.1 hypothetical protein [Limnobacter sp.]